MTFIVCSASRSSFDARQLDFSSQPTIQLGPETSSKLLHRLQKATTQARPGNQSPKFGSWRAHGPAADIASVTNLLVLRLPFVFPSSLLYSSLSDYPVVMPLANIF